MKPESDSSVRRKKYSAFSVTHWSMIERAKGGSSPEAHAALEELCSVYWRPLYAYILRRGLKEPGAQDLTQAFFARLLDKNYLAAVDRRKGKFRTFLLVALDHFLANHWRDSRAQKRGGGVAFISFDEAFDETIFASSPALRAADPEHFFEQQWAITVIAQVFARLQADFVKSNRAALFEDLKAAITFENSDTSYAELSLKHGISAAAVKQRVYYLRKRYGELLVAELARTVSSPEEVEQELRALFAAVSR